MYTINYTTKTTMIITPSNVCVVILFRCVEAEPVCAGATLGAAEELPEPLAAGGVVDVVSDPSMPLQM